MRDVRRDYGQGVPIEIEDPAKPLELLSSWIQDALFLLLFHTVNH